MLFRSGTPSASTTNRFARRRIRQGRRGGRGSSIPPRLQKGRPGRSRAFWRRGRDSNPRHRFSRCNTLAGCRLRPLGHLSKPLAEGEGFEPPVGFAPTAVFKTAAFNRSANPPRYGRTPYYAGKGGAVSRLDRKSTRLNSSHIPLSRMPSSA